MVILLKIKRRDLFFNKTALTDFGVRHRENSEVQIAVFSE